MSIFRFASCYFLSCCFWLSSFFALAQHTQTYQQADLAFRNGIQLFEKQLFSAAKQQFATYLQQAENTHALQAEYYQLLCALQLKEPEMEGKIKDFAARYAGSLQVILLYRQTANYFFEQQDYDNTIAYYTPVAANKLQTPEDFQAAFQLGYAYFEKKKYDEALEKFAAVKQNENTYTSAACYYSGAIYFLQKIDNEAISNLEKAQTSAQYQAAAEGILPLIYYRQGRYNEVIEFVKRIENRGEQPNEKLLLVAANSCYEKQDFQQATNYFESYAQTAKNLEKSTKYRFAFSSAEVGKNNQAIDFFSQVAEGQDSLAQNAAYNLGILYLDTQNKPLAINAFDKVRKMTFDIKLEEQSAWNYAKLSFELKDFSNTIRACEFFLQKYPNSPHEDDISHLLTESYLFAGNYTEALSYLDKVATKSKKMQAAYQRLAYNQAVELFNADNYAKAEDLLRKSLKFQSNKDLANSAYYWLGEMYSYQEKYDSALVYYNRLNSSSAVYQEAFYGKGYAAYNLKDYETAKRNFEQYLAVGTQPQNKADAKLRLADCYFVAKDYEAALDNYAEAEQKQGADLEYLYYQKATVLANQEKPDEALRYLDKLLVQYPNSKYYELALFRKGLVHFDHNSKGAALAVFSDLITQKPQSSLVPDALLKRAICYQLQNEQEKAITDYTQLLKQHSAHATAEEAIQALQDLNEKGYHIPDYEELSNNFSNANPNSKAAVAGEYNTAKANYDNGNYARAINALQNFTKKYPDSEFTPDAFYFLGMSYDQSQAYDNALFAFSKVRGSYEIRALQRAAEIEYLRNNYLNAQVKYEAMLKNPTINKRYEGNALAGLLQCNFQQKNYDKVKDLANQLYNKNHTKAWSMADLYLAKIMIEKGETAPALLQLQKTVQTAQDQYGAEAQYLMGVLLRQQKKYEESTKALIEVRNKYVNYTAWLYEAFLLIADNYVSLNNKFQAKATLQSVIDAAADEKIKEKARQKLAGL